jgi:hypothetical protein
MLFQKLRIVSMVASPTPAVLDEGLNVRPDSCSQCGDQLVRWQPGLRRSHFKSEAVHVHHNLQYERCAYPSPAFVYEEAHHPVLRLGLEGFYASKQHHLSKHISSRTLCISTYSFDNTALRCVESCGRA